MKKINFIVLVLCATGLDAQFKRPFFNTISVENGLPEGVVRVSLQDKLGYLWFGTQNGLVRYNGYNCKLYPIPDDDGAPINAPSINNLLEDKFGVLWVGLYNKGYYIYDRQKDIFKKIPKDKIALDSFNVAGTSKFLYDKENDIGWGMRYDTGLGSWAVELADFFHGSHEVFSAAGKGRYLIPAGKNYADIMVDSSGNAWLVTDSLLSRYDKGSASFKPFFLMPANMNKIMFNYIMRDPVNKDLIWITTDPDSSLDINKTKIIQVNIKTKKYKTYDHIASDPFSIAGTCTEMYTDPQKRIFFYTAHGISMFNRENEKFTNYVLSAPGIAANIPIPITSIAADKKGNLWLGGNDFNGLFCLNTTTAAINYYSHTEEGGSLPNFTSGINKLFFDKAGILWVSLPFSGIAWLDPKRSFFNPVIIDPPVKKEDKNTGPEFYNITGVYNDSIFFVRDTKNIFTWNHRTNDFNKIDLGESNKSVGVKSVYVDKQGLIWMSSFLGYGLFCYNPYDKTTKNYRNDLKDSFSIGSNYTSMVREDNDGNLWISTGGNGLNSFNKKTGRFTRYPFITNNGTIKPNNALDDRIVHCVLCGKNGIIWIGTNLGSLNKLDTKTGKFSTYLDPKAGFQCIEDLFEDNHGRLWAGSYLSGLFLVNKDSGILKHFTETDGLPSNDIRSINEDKKGNIWLATSHGLSKLDPVSNTITNYTTVNGLSVVQTQEIYKNSDGMFYVSITNGVIPFDPDDFAENKIPPEVVIESIKYHTSANNRDTILPISEPQQLSLRYNENKISFQYVALHFSNAALNQYAYQLVGYDKDWIPAGTARTVTYTNLSPGTYTFKVKAANSDGVWNETGAGFTFTILPPWWKTWWAYCLYALVIGGIVWAYVQYRSKALRRENLVLEQKVEHRTKQLQQSIESLKATQSQLIQSEKMASLGELTAGIAHEIQNPLNFVNNFSEVNKELIDELQEERNKEQGTKNEELQTELLNDIKQNLEKINHHGKRADAIVKGMLQHSRSSNGVKEPTDINALADEYLRLAYHGLRAKDKSFNATLKTDFDESIGNITIIPQDIGRVLLNLITNAFYVVDEKKKQSAPGYEAIVSISTKKINNKVEIKVADNGNGIPKNIIDKIFQPFFTTKPTGQGTGLGLSLAYDIIKAHGGELKVETKEEEGTEFIIHLPVNLNNQPGSNQNV